MLAAAAYMIVFRIVHILAGIFWAGSVYLFVVFIQPSVAAIAPAGAPFMAELLGKRKLVDVLIGLGSTTVIGGLFLYWHDWHLYGSFGKWVSSRFGADLRRGDRGDRGAGDRDRGHSPQRRAAAGHGPPSGRSWRAPIARDGR